MIPESDFAETQADRASDLEERIGRLERRAWPVRSLGSLRRRSRSRSMIAAWSRLLAFVPTRRAAAVLFLVAFVVYWIESLGWPMAKGRDTWDYLAYYLQLLDSNPPLSELQVFRTPLTPIVVGAPLDLGGVWALEVVFALLFATSIVAWSADRADVRKDPGTLRRAATPRLSGLRDDLPPGLERRRLRDRPGALRTRAGPHARASHWPKVRSARRRDRGPRADQAREPGVPGRRSRPVDRVCPVAQPAHLDGRLPAGRARTSCRLGRRQRCSLRRHDRRARRERLGPVPSRLPGRRDDLARERRRLARAGRSHRAGGARRSLPSRGSAFRSTNT